MLRYVLLAAAIVDVAYGVVHFRGINLSSPRYVTRPDARWWSWLRLLNDAEWTAEGLTYRRRFLAWLGVSVLITCAFVIYL